jgi:DNA-binding response OmpR family regulator
VRVLIADSDPVFTLAARRALRSDALVVEVVGDAAAALDLAAALPYSVIILDAALPGSQEPPLLPRLRRLRISTPVLVLLSDPAPAARVAALADGADDCLVKPVLLPELVARVHALARRVARHHGDCLEVEDLVIHTDRHRVFRSGHPILLTDREYALLVRLVRAHGETVPHRELLATIWQEDTPPEPNFVNIVVSRLRKKIDAPFATPLIQTIRGNGYAIRQPAR